MRNRNLAYKSGFFAVISFCIFNVFACSKKNNDTTVITPIVANNIVQFVFTSDQHYGLTKTAFQGATNVDARIVNAALVGKLNALSTSTFPNMLFMPTGGVDTTKENIGAWFKAGVCAVGMGSKLISKALLEAKDYATIEAATKEVLATVKAIKG